MRTCDRCGWRAIAPSPAAAAEQYAAHLVGVHGDDVEAAVPAGMVEVRLDEEDEWRTVTLAEAKRLHAEHHDGTD